MVGGQWWSVVVPGNGTETFFFQNIVLKLFSVG